MRPAVPSKRAPKRERLGPSLRQMQAYEELILTIYDSKNILDKKDYFAVTWHFESKVDFVIQTIIYCHTQY